MEPSLESMASQARRNAGNCPEMPGKVALIRKTRHNRNLRNGKVSVSEELLGMLDPSLNYIAVRRYSERLAKGAGKMMNGQLRNFGEHFQSDTFLQMRIYVFAHAIGARRRKAPAICGRID
jgi:hypothetical protein